MTEVDDNSYRKYIYSESIISRRVRLPFTAVGNKKKLEKNLETMISHLLEGKCSKEGYIQVGTLKILTYSVGLQVGNDVEFEVVIKCYICNPTEGMRIRCVVKNNTGAGVRAELNKELEMKSFIPERQYERNKDKYKDQDYNSPIVVYLASEQHMGNTLDKYNVGDIITIEVIGQRYELNDLHVNIIGKLVEK